MNTTTKNGIRRLDKDTVILLNGREIRIASKEGAHEFVDTVGTDFISTNLTVAANDEELACACYLMIVVNGNASPEKIVAGFPESELRIFIEYTRNTLDTLSTDRNWLRAGTVSECHVRLLETVANFSKHPSFARIFLSNEGMEAVAKFYASRKKNDTPNHEVAALILLIFYTSVGAFQEEGASDENGFGTLEKTGILGQLFRCIPADPEVAAIIVTRLQACLQLVKKKLKSGTPTGDILDAVIAGKDGPINEKVKADLSRLQTLARLSNVNNNCTDPKMCQHCDKIETLDGAKLMKCQRCNLTYYCNRACQVADWKRHKRTCSKIGSGSETRSAFKKSHTIMWAFVESNYFDIAKEVYKKTQEYNVPKKELLVEIDFYGDAPALRDEFKVRLTSGFLGESALVDAPGRFHTDAHKKFIREAYERVTGDDLLAMCRASNNTTNITRLRLPVAGTGYQLLSDETVESIGTKDYVRMVACMGQQFTNKYFENRSGLT